MKIESNSISRRVKYSFLCALAVLFATVSADAQCSLSLTNLRVSEDYAYGGSSYVSASFLIDWENEPAGEFINVRLLDAGGGILETRVIEMTYEPFPGKVRDMPNLQEISFEVAADGTAGYQITAEFSGGVCVATPLGFDAPVGYLSPVCGVDDLGGMVFKDFDMDGIRSTAEVVGVPDVTVTVIDSSGVTQSVVTDKYGRYLVSVPPADYPVRVEFSSIPVVPFQATSTPSGADNGTTVQFVSSPDCDVDLGVALPAGFSQPNPDVITTCFINGNPDPAAATGGETSPSMDGNTIVSFSYALAGAKDDANMAMLALAGETGSVWGVAWDPHQQRIFTSAFLRRYAGLGSLGLGGIYVDDYIADADGLPGATGVDGWDASSTDGASFDLLALTDTDGTPIDLGSIPSNAARGLSTDAVNPSHDVEAFGKVGKIGMGDIDLAEDGSALWVTNLFEKTIIHVPLPSDGSAPTTATSFPIDTSLVTCSNGEMRPWALKVFEGKIYSGVVCTAENGGEIEDLLATVLRFDPVTQVWDKVMEFPLTYPKGYAAKGLANLNGWYPWEDDHEAWGNLKVHPQPMFCDIEFDIDGSMVFGFADRGGFQMGAANYAPDVNDTRLTSYVSGGDILRAYFAGGDVFLLENNGKAGPASGAGVDNLQGPGLGEFYEDRFRGAHTENSLGGLALSPGSGEVIAGMIDPFDFNTNGVRYLDNATGAALRNYNVFHSPDDAGTFNKANGLGDMELVVQLPEILEIGNRVWSDDNGDGTQDPGEAPIADVTVHLYDAAGVVVATRATDSEGNYYFDAADGVQPNTRYYVVVDAAEFTGGDLDGMFATVPFGGSAINDSNAITLSTSGDPLLPAALAGEIGAGVTTGNLMENDHSIDMGFNGTPPPLLVGDTVWLDLDQDGQQDVSEPGVAGVTVNLYNDSDTLINTTVTNGDGVYLFSSDSGGAALPADSYYLEFVEPPGYIFTTPDSGAESTDSDAGADGVTDTFALAASDMDFTWDAGLIANLSLGSTVFNDFDDSGVQDPGEAGFAAVDVELYDANDNLVATTSTTALGDYYFGNLEAGDYYVVIPSPPANAPASSTGAATSDDDVDGDDNGQQTSPGAASFSPTITLAAGTESVAESFQGGAQDDASDADGNMTVDFGFVGIPVALGSTVWIDTTANGVFDAGEGVSGVAVELYLAGETPGVDMPVATATTGTDGVYEFDGLNEGDYIVYLPAPNFVGGGALVGQTSLGGGSVDNNIDNDDDGLDTPENGGIRSNVINLAPGSEVAGEPTAGLYTGGLPDDNVNSTVDFGFEANQGLVAIGSTVWIDADTGGNDNDMFDSGEGVDGVTVELYEAGQVPGVDGPVRVITTSGGGSYSFDQLPEGDYIVHIPAGEFSSGPLAGTGSLNGAGSDDGIDHDDNGLDTPVNGGVSSLVIGLAVGGEPTADDDNGYTGSLADNSVDTTVDFGFETSSGQVAVGSRVWTDHGDGIFQAGEGVDGVIVELYISGQNPGVDAPVATTTTSGDGFYVFDQLDAGDYIVHIPAGEFANGPLAGATSLTGQDTADLDEDMADNENGGDSPVNGGISSGTVMLTQGGEPVTEGSQSDYPGTLDDDDVNMAVDFAFIAAEPDPALGNVVFIDANGNGVMDAGEGVNGVAVELYTADQEPGVDTPYRSTTTVADGNYLFDLLPEGDFIVYIPEENFAPGAPLYQYQSLPGAGGDDTNDDDVDENGLDQLVNGGVISAVIMIRDGGEPINESGSATGPTSVLADDQVNYTIDFGFEQAPPLGAIGNYVWVDENSDGYQDAGEPGIPNVTVQLKDEDGNVIATTVTDSQGGYLFDELPAGDYSVDVDESTIPTGMAQTPPSTLPGADLGNQDHSGDGYPVTIGGSEPWENLTADFGYNYNPADDVNNPTSSPVAALGDRIWIDTDQDGVQDPNEIGVDGVEVTLYNDPDGDGVYDDPVATTTTDENGNYLFDGLAPDGYVVEVTDDTGASHPVLGGDYAQTGDPDHFASTDTSPGNNDNTTTTPVVLGPGDVFLNVDFGYNPIKPEDLGSIGDTVWMDTDADGVQDSGEPGIPGVTVALIQDTNENGVFDSGDLVIATDTTDSNGNYLFDDLPVDDGDGDADYLVWVNDTDSVLAGTTQTYDSDGPLSSPDISAVALTSAVPDDLDQDFGYTPGEPLGSVGDYVWLDADSAGDQNEAGAGLGDVVMELLDHTGAVVATTTTSSDGYYLFDGLPVEDNSGVAGADYSVRVAASNFAPGGALENYTNTYDPDDMTSSPDSTGGTVTLSTSDPHDRLQDFGYVTTALGSIGDTVWFDADSSGGDQTTQGGEPGIPCVLVSLYADDGDGIFEPNTDDMLVGQQYTDSQGNYLFTDLPLGTTYFVEVDQQSLPGFVDPVSTHDGTDGGTDGISSATPTAGTPHVTDQDFSYPPASGATELGFIGDYIWFDEDSSGGDESTAGGESGLQGVVVVLKDNTGTEIARTTTDASGYYAFIGLPLDDGAGAPGADYTVEVFTRTLPNYVDRTSTHDGTDGGTDSTSTATLTAGAPYDLDQDFSYPPATGLGAIGDYVWLDSDGAGDQNETGTGIENVIVELLDDSGNVIATTTTDENGYYLFPDLPLDETYQVQVAPENFVAGSVLSGMTNTFDSDTPGDSVGETVTLTDAAPTDLGQDFGYFGADDGSIGTTVWEDTDADGTLDPGEPGIEGVTIDLYRDLDGNGVIDPGEPLIGTTTTDSSGEYLFEGLPFDDYIVDVTDTAGVLGGYWHSDGPNDGADDNSQVDAYPVTIDVGNPNDITADFGYYVDPAAVGNYVWFDTDGDGVQESGEDPIVGAVVTLTITYPDGTEIELVDVTDATGHYDFGNLLLDEDYNTGGGGAQPSYELSVATPAGTEPTAIGVGDDKLDSEDPAGTAAVPVQGEEDTAQQADATTEPVIASYDFGFTTAKSDTFADWQTDNPLGGDNAPGDNPDGDIWSNALEYALCLHPENGTTETLPGGSGGFCVELGGPSGTSGTVDAFFSRPLGSLDDVTYTLQVAPGIGSPPAWVTSTAIPVIIDNGDGTETVTYPDLEDQNSDGIARLCVEIDGDASGPHYTMTHGWHTQTNGGACETWSNPYAPKSVFSGTPSATSADNLTLTVAGTPVLGSGAHYIEVLSGTFEGHRFDVASVGADTVTLDGTSPRNTFDPLPDLTNAPFALRPHATLDDLAPPALFAAQANPDDGDRILLYVNGAWVTYWVFDMFGTQPNYWTSDGDDGLDDVGDSVIDACQGFFLHPKSGDVDVTSVGVVRDWDFACPLNAGYNLVGSGYPIDQSPDDRAMFKDDSDGVQDWFTASNDPLLADQVLLWLGDEAAAAEGYDTYFRVDLGVAAYDHWTYQGDSNLADADSDVLFELGRAAFYDMIVGHDRSDPADVWVWPAPWSP